MLAALEETGVIEAQTHTSASLSSTKSG
jgi:hypothetical protein